MRIKRFDEISIVEASKEVVQEKPLDRSPIKENKLEGVKKLQKVEEKKDIQIDREQIKREEEQRLWEAREAARQRYLALNERYYQEEMMRRQMTGGRVKTVSTSILTFLGASTHNTYYNPNEGTVSTITSNQINFDNGTYPTNSIVVDKLYNLDTTSQSYTEAVSSIYQHSVFAYNTDDNLYYFMGYDGVDTKFGKIDNDGNITVISTWAAGTTDPITQLLYVGSNKFLFYIGLGNTTQMYDMTTSGVDTLSTTFAPPDITNDMYVTSINIVNGIYYLFFRFFDGLFVSTYNPVDGTLNNTDQVSMVSMPSEINTDTGSGGYNFKVVDLVSAVSDYGFPNTTGNKVYANILVADSANTDLSTEYYYFIVEINVTNGDATYITNGDNVFDLSYYKKSINT